MSCVKRYGLVNDQYQVMNQETLGKNDNANTEGGESEANTTMEIPEPSINSVKQSDSADVQRFLMIDRGEDIIKQLNDVSQEYRRQMGQLAHEVDLLWHVLRTFMMMFGPLLVGVVILIMAKCTLPRGHQIIDMNNIITSLFVGIFTILIGIRYHPFHSAIERYLTFRKSKNSSNSAAESPAPENEAQPTDSESSTVQEPTEEKEENTENTQSPQEEGQHKNESEYFDMLPEPNA